MNAAVNSLREYMILQYFHFAILNVLPGLLGAVGHRSPSRVPPEELMESSSRAMTVLSYWPNLPYSRPPFSLDWMGQNADGVRLMAEAARERGLLSPEIIPSDDLIERLQSRQTSRHSGSYSNGDPVSV